MDTVKIKQLLQKRKSDQLTDEEKAILDTWYLKLSQTETVIVDEDDMTNRLDAVWAGLEMNRKPKRDIYRLNLIRISSAAAIILMIGSVFFYYYKKDAQQQLISNIAKNDIAPGGNKAILTLANGEKISLTDAQNGILASQPGVQITKTSAGQLIYTISDRKAENSTAEYNTIETPKGGQYQVSLPDGTKVWLNAASSLKYPSTFEKSVTRKVELNGEAYFEVAKDKAHPFIVESKDQQVEVLGTHFNINSYSDEKVVKTTLLEGSVRVSLHAAQPVKLAAKFVMLLPNQQASVTGGSDINVNEVNAENAIAWKNGLFMFNDEPLGEVMQKISRWYGVEVNINDPALYQKTVYGTISRYSNVSKVLNMLEKTGEMQFEIAGNSITVKRK